MAKGFYIGGGAALKGRKMFVGRRKTVMGLELEQSRYEEKFDASQYFAAWQMGPVDTQRGVLLEPDMNKLYADNIISSPGDFVGWWLEGAGDIYYQFHSVEREYFTSNSHIFLVSRYRLTVTRSETARRVVKGYIGDENGVASLFYSGGEVEYYGRAQDLSAARTKGAAASNRSYAVYGGGLGAPSAVDAYGRTLTRVSAEPLAEGRYSLAAAAVGDVLLFAGGRNDGGASGSVEGYDSDLSKVSCEGLSRARYDLAGASNGSFALFAGGTNEDQENFRLVQSYDSSLTRGSAESLDTYKWGMVGVSAEGLAVFAGGSTNQGESYGDTLMEAYDSSLTRTTADIGRVFIRGAGTCHGELILLAGGRSGAWSSNMGRKAAVQAFDKSLTLLGTYELSDARDELAGASVEGYALFAGGENLTDDGVVPRWGKTVNIFDESMTRTLGTPLERYHKQLVGASIGDFALFMGGVAMDTVTLESSSGDHNSAAVYAWNI